MLVRAQRMDILGKMAGGLAHDFKNVLTVINGCAELISRNPAGSKVAHFAETITSAGDRAAKLTQNLLTFSRGETVNNEVFNVNDLVRETEQMLQSLINGHIKVSVDIPEEPVSIVGDAGKIHQCILNLCINARDALKARPDGIISIRMNKNENLKMLNIEVRDNGPGIQPEIIGKIFDPFFTTKGKGEGTGLGLSVVYGIVKAHKGDIVVESRPGEGASFIINLPLINNQKEKHTVIVIDGDDESRNSTETILEKQQYAHCCFRSYSDAASWRAGHDGIPVTALFFGRPAAESVAWRIEQKEMKAVWVGKSDIAPVDGDVALKIPFPPGALVEIIRSLAL
jgi:hypothetical protein